MANKEASEEFNILIAQIDRKGSIDIVTSYRDDFYHMGMEERQHYMVWDSKTDKYVWEGTEDPVDIKVSECRTSVNIVFEPTYPSFYAVNEDGDIETDGDSGDLTNKEEWTLSTKNHCKSTPLEQFAEYREHDILASFYGEGWCLL